MSKNSNLDFVLGPKKSKRGPVLELGRNKKGPVQCEIRTESDIRISAFQHFSSPQNRFSAIFHPNLVVFSQAARPVYLLGIVGKNQIVTRRFGGGFGPKKHFLSHFLKIIDFFWSVQNAVLYPFYLRIDKIELFVLFKLLLLLLFLGIWTFSLINDLFVLFKLLLLLLFLGIWTLVLFKLLLLLLFLGIWTLVLFKLLLLLLFLGI